MSHSRIVTSSQTRALIYSSPSQRPPYKQQSLFFSGRKWGDRSRLLRVRVNTVHDSNSHDAPTCQSVCVSQFPLVPATGIFEWEPPHTVSYTIMRGVDGSIDTMMPPKPPSLPPTPHVSSVHPSSPRSQRSTSRRRCGARRTRP